MVFSRPLCPRQLVRRGVQIRRGLKERRRSRMPQLAFLKLAPMEGWGEGKGILTLRDRTKRSRQLPLSPAPA